MQIISQPKIVHQGIDTLVIGVNSTDEILFNEKFRPFVDKIKKAKEQAQTIKTYGEKVVKTNLGLKYGDFSVSSKGLGAYVGFVKNDDVFFSVADTQFSADSLYHLKLQFRAVYLLKYGHTACINAVKGFLFQVFGEKFEIKILRLDVCTDVAGIKYTPTDFFNFRSLKKISHFGQSVQKIENDDDVLVSEKDNDLSGVVALDDINVNNFMRFNRFEGMSFGKTPDMFRVYDKIKQIQAKNVSTLIFTKWELNGFDFNRDLCVFRHECEFGRARIIRLMPEGVTDEINFLLDNVGKFWHTGLKICKWYDLSDKERGKLFSGEIQTNYAKQIYHRVDIDETRFRFWDEFLSQWGEDRLTPFSKRDLIKSKDLRQAKKALKGFISAVYTNLGIDENNFLIVLEAVKNDLACEGIDLHEYGLSKLCGNFMQNEKAINELKGEAYNQFTPNIYYALGDLMTAFSRIKNEEYKKPIKDALQVIKNQRFE